MRKFLVTAALLVFSAAACSPAPAAQPPAASSPTPRVSAAAACRDFAAWWAATGTGRDLEAGAATLRKAVTEAPSGQLYQDISAAETVVKDAAAGTGGNPVLAVAAQVRNDCSAVNPSS